MSFLDSLIESNAPNEPEQDVPRRKRTSSRFLNSLMGDESATQAGIEEIQEEKPVSKKKGKFLDSLQDTVGDTNADLERLVPSGPPEPEKPISVQMAEARQKVIPPAMEAAMQKEPPGGILNFNLFGVGIPQDNEAIRIYNEALKWGEAGQRSLLSPDLRSSVLGVPPGAERAMGETNAAIDRMVGQAPQEKQYQNVEDIYNQRIREPFEQGLQNWQAKDPIEQSILKYNAQNPNAPISDIPQAAAQSFIELPGQATAGFGRMLANPAMWPELWAMGQVNELNKILPKPIGRGGPGEVSVGQLFKRTMQNLRGKPPASSGNVALDVAREADMEDMLALPGRVGNQRVGYAELPPLPEPVPRDTLTKPNIFAEPREELPLRTDEIFAEQKGGYIPPEETVPPEAVATTEKTPGVRSGKEALRLILEDEVFQPLPEKAIPADAAAKSIETKLQQSPAGIIKGKDIEQELAAIEDAVFTPEEKARFGLPEGAPPKESVLSGQAGFIDPAALAQAAGKIVSSPVKAALKVRDAMNTVYRSYQEVAAENIIRRIDTPLKAKGKAFIDDILVRAGKNPEEVWKSFDDFFRERGLHTPPEFKAAYEEMLKAIDMGDSLAKTMETELNKLPELQRGAVRDMILNGIPGNATLSPRANAMARNLRRVKGKLGTQLKDAGILGEQAWQEHGEGASYLSRPFEVYENRGAWSKILHKRGIGGIIPDPYHLRKDEFGLVYQLWDDAEKRWAPQYEKFGTDPAGEAARNARLIELRKESIDSEYINAARKAKVLTGVPADKSVKMVKKFDPLTPQELASLGEIKDVAYIAPKDIMVATRNLAYDKFYKFIEANPIWTLPKGVNKSNVPPGFYKLPDSPRFGILRDRYVSYKIHDELIHRNDYDISYGGTMRPLYDIWNKGYTAWKIGKVILDPAVQAGNLGSNYVFHRIGGLYDDSLLGALPDFHDMAYKNTMHPRMQEYESMGGLRTSLVKNELSALGERFFKGKSKGAAATVANLAKAIADKGMKLYEFNEQWFKYAKFKQLREQGVPIEAAFKDANHWGINYRDRARALVLLSKLPVFGSPFATWAYYMPVRLGKAMLGFGPRGFDPSIAMRFGAVVTALKAIDYYYKKRDGIIQHGFIEHMNPLREKEKREKQIEPEWFEKFGRVGKAAKFTNDMFGTIPYIGSERTQTNQGAETQYKHLNLTRGTPFQALANPSVLTGLVSEPSGRLLSDLLYNRSLFNDQVINDPLKYSDVNPITDYIYKMAMPSLTPGIPGVSHGGFSAEKIGAALTGTTDYYGRKPNLPEALLRSTAAIKTEQTIPEFKQHQESKEYLFMVQRLLNNMTRDLQRNPKNSAKIEAGYTKKFNDLQKKYEKRQREIWGVQ